MGHKQFRLVDRRKDAACIKDRESWVYLSQTSRDLRFSFAQWGKIDEKASSLNWFAIFIDDGRRIHPWMRNRVPVFTEDHPDKLKACVTSRCPVASIYLNLGALLYEHMWGHRSAKQLANFAIFTE